MPEPPLVYLILGIPGAGRRDVLLDLLGDGLPAGERALYFRPAGEPPSPVDDALAAHPAVTVAEWRLREAKVVHGRLEGAADRVFFLAPGDADPADVAEALGGWTEHNGCTVARVLTVVDCGFLRDNPGAGDWYAACVHFSDVVLLNHRQAAGNTWVRDFEAGFKRARHPARFLMVKKGRVDNPAEVLEPEARRLSLHFDHLTPIEEDELEADERPEDLRPDKYVERLESGRRAHPIPDIRPFL